MSSKSKDHDLLTVLVVDDDPIFRSLVEARLVQSGCRLLQAGDGGEAWRLVRSQALDVAIVDYEMPGLDGIALIQCLRSHPKTLHIPILMCTARADTSAMQLALEAGASSFMTKPVNWTAFQQHIEHLLRLKQKEAGIAAELSRTQSALGRKCVEVGLLIEDLEIILEACDRGGGLSVDRVRALRTRIDAFAYTYAQGGAISVAPHSIDAAPIDTGLHRI